MATFPCIRLPPSTFSGDQRPVSGSALCNAAFAECDGLDMTMDVKSIREGGNNTRRSSSSAQ